MSSHRILVTGATGKQGGAVIRALQGSSTLYQIFALTRNATSPLSKELEKRGVILIEGNQNAPDEIFSKVKNIYGVFSVQISVGQGQNAESEEHQGKGLFDAAQRAGIKHFVYSGADRHGFEATYVPHFIPKHNIEKHIMENANTTQWTILRPTVFMDHITRGFQSRLFFTGLEAYMGPEKALQYIAVEDIGVFTVKAFEVVVQGIFI